MRHPNRTQRTSVVPVRASMYLKPWYLSATLRDQFRLCRCAHDRAAHNDHGTRHCKRCRCWCWRRKLFRTWRVT